MFNRIPSQQNSYLDPNKAWPDYFRDSTREQLLQSFTNMLNSQIRSIQQQVDGLNDKVDGHSNGIQSFNEKIAQLKQKAIKYCKALLIQCGYSGPFIDYSSELIYLLSARNVLIDPNSDYLFHLLAECSRIEDGSNLVHHLHEILTSSAKVIDQNSAAKVIYELGLKYNLIPTKEESAIPIMHERLKGDQLGTLGRLPTKEFIQNADLLTGVKVQLGDSTIRARILDPDKDKDIASAKRLRDLGYQRFNAGKFKAEKLGLNPYKTIIVQVSLIKERDGESREIDVASITLEMGEQPIGELAMTEAFRLMLDKDALSCVFADWIISGESIESFPFSNKALASQQPSTVAHSIGIPLEEFNRKCEVESLTFASVSDELWDDAFSTEDDVYPAKVSADRSKFGVQYALAMVVGTEAVRRMSGNDISYLLAMLQPSLQELVTFATGVEIPVFKKMVINPLGSNKPKNGNGTTLNIDYFNKFHPYFLSNYIDKETGIDVPIGKLTTDDRARFEEYLSDPDNERSFILRLCRYIFSGNTPGPIMAMAKADKYLSDLIESVNSIYFGDQVNANGHKANGRIDKPVQEKTREA